MAHTQTSPETTRGRSLCMRDTSAWAPTDTRDNDTYGPAFRKVVRPPPRAND